MKTEPISINRELCIGCGQCVEGCVASHIVLKDGKVELTDTVCIECGHCYAVCPVEAVDMPGYDKSGCEEVASMSEFDPDRLLLAMKSRRTIRKFKNLAVSQEDIDRIIEAGRYSPTAMNGQNVHFIILDKNMAQVERAVYEEVVRKNWFSNNLEDNIGQKFIFRDAPLAIVVAEKRADNAALASAYMELMADSLGLGVMYCGLVRVAAEDNEEMLKLIGVPEGLKVITCLVIGHPDVEYIRVAPRKKANLIIN